MNRRWRRKLYRACEARGRVRRARATSGTPSPSARGASSRPRSGAGCGGSTSAASRELLLHAARSADGAPRGRPPALRVAPPLAARRPLPRSRARRRARPRPRHGATTTLAAPRFARRSTSSTGTCSSASSCPATRAGTELARRPHVAARSEPDRCSLPRQLGRVPRRAERELPRSSSAGARTALAREGDVAMRLADEATLDGDLDALFALHRARWGSTRDRLRRHAVPPRARARGARAGLAAALAARARRPPDRRLARLPGRLGHELLPGRPRPGARPALGRLPAHGPLDPLRDRGGSDRVPVRPRRRGVQVQVRERRPRARVGRAEPRRGRRGHLCSRTGGSIRPPSPPLTRAPTARRRPGSPSTKGREAWSFDLDPPNRVTRPLEGQSIASRCRHTHSFPPARLLYSVTALVAASIVASVGIRRSRPARSPVQRELPEEGLPRPSSLPTAQPSRPPCSSPPRSTSPLPAMTFEVDDTPLAPKDTAAPYETPWDTTKSSNGTHVLRVTAHDSAGKSSSLEHRITVDNPTAPPRPPPTRPHRPSGSRARRRAQPSRARRASQPPRPTTSASSACSSRSTARTSAPRTRALRTR